MCSSDLTTDNEFVKFDGMNPTEIAVDYADNVVLDLGSSIGLLHTQTQILKEWNLVCYKIISDSGKIYCKNSNIIYRLDTISNEVSEWDMPTDSRVGSLAIDTSGDIFFQFFDGHVKIGKISVKDNLVTLWSNPIVESGEEDPMKVDSLGNVYFGPIGLNKLIISDDRFLKITLSNDNTCYYMVIDSNDNIYCSNGVSSATKILIKQ